MKQSLGEFISTLRKANGYTQAEVAERLNVSNRTLSSWETDRTAPDVALLPALADIYGVTVDEILRCERQPKNAEEGKLSQAAQAAMRKNRFARFCGKRILCLGLGLLGALVFVAMGAVLLYSSAPLWLSIIFMVLGAGGNIACIILLSYFYYSALRQEGIIFESDCTEEKKAYTLTLRHKFSNVFILNCLPYLLGAIVYLTVYYTAGLSYRSIIVGDISVKIDYTTPTTVLVILDLIFGLCMLIFGFVYNRKGIKKLGNESQLKAVKHNKKLLAKLCGFGAIPIAVFAVLFFTFISIYFDSVEKVYFTARSADEVIRNFQTLNIDKEFTYEHLTGAYEDGEEIIARATFPAGEYYLDFGSETFYELTKGNDCVKFYDLGNGYYGERIKYVYVSDGPDYYWQVYRLYDGMSIADAAKDDDHFDFLIFYMRYDNVSFEFAGEKHYAVKVTQQELFYDHYGWHGNGVSDYSFIVRGTYYEKENEYRYELVRRSNYFPLFGWLWLGASGATVITCPIIWFVKRKKVIYEF